MSSGNRMRNDLPALVEQAITGHPGYAEFAAWCQSQLIHPYQIYFLVWQASREAVVVELPLAMDGQMWVSQGVESITAQGLKVAK
ncbi:hypothetical protein [Pseudomonas putida]|uniref:hypothetical protein n=1 Tax=Pseudomonas putida TaxID=303 RepID=UPI00034F2116|nr:hypothetical protein [Pseudomonas putida]AGN82943.1 hypothetical protein L483_20980 [Pseudomonas putida H8234]